MANETNTGDQKVSPTKMIKVPGPGQFRGEGEWETFEKFCKEANLTVKEANEYWDELQWTGYLPTKEE